MLTIVRDCKSSRVQNAYVPPFPRLLPALKCELYIVIKEPWDAKADKKSIGQVLAAQNRDKNTL